MLARVSYEFLGKDSMQFKQTIKFGEIEHPSGDIGKDVYRSLQSFVAGKNASDDIFETLDPSKLNAHLSSLMKGLSAKVFRTYNASITLCSELQKTDDSVSKKQIESEGHVLALFNYYNIANKNVAELCNHQRATPASHQAAMERMDGKISELEKLLKATKKEGTAAKVAALQKRLVKMRADRSQKDETKNVSLGTSKINYNDPRITVAWCKRFEVPIQKPFAKTLLAKFQWAMHVEPSYRF